MGNYTISWMFENPTRDRQAINFTTNVPKIPDLKSSFEEIFSKNWRWVPLICNKPPSAFALMETVSRKFKRNHFRRIQKVHFRLTCIAHKRLCLKLGHLYPVIKAYVSLYFVYNHWNAPLVPQETRMGLDLSGEERAIDSQKHKYDKINFKSLHVL